MSDNRRKAIKINWCSDPDRRNRQLRRWKKRVLSPTRVFDQDILDRWGIREDVTILTGRVCLTDFLSQPEPTYVVLTYEFLSSFEYHRNRRAVSFQLGGRDFDLTLPEFAQALGLPFNDGDDHNDVMDVETVDNFRKAIIGHLPETNDTRLISHPALFYIQSVLSSTLFARSDKEGGEFCIQEMWILYCMLHRNNEERNLLPNYANLFANHVEYLNDTVRGDDEVKVGGIVTKIAQNLGIQSTELTAHWPGLTVDSNELYQRGVYTDHPSGLGPWVWREGPRMMPDGSFRRRRHYQVPIRSRLVPPRPWRTWILLDTPIEEED